MIKGFCVCDDRNVALDELGQHWMASSVTRLTGLVKLVILCFAVVRNQSRISYVFTKLHSTK